MKKKLLPPFLMLLAGAISSIVMYLEKYEIKKMLWVLVTVLIAFYLAGVLFKKVLESFEAKQEEQKDLEEGKVIEKETESESAASEQEEKEEQEP